MKTVLLVTSQTML